MNPEFRVHFLTEDGKQKACEIAVLFNGLLENLKSLCEHDGRYLDICRLKLEEACFYAKKNMSEAYCKEEG